MTNNDTLLDIIGRLGAAVAQSGPSDDQIIMDHVKAALVLARDLRRRYEHEMGAGE